MQDRFVFLIWLHLLALTHPHQVSNQAFEDLLDRSISVFTTFSESPHGHKDMDAAVVAFDEGFPCGLGRGAG